MLTGAQFRLLGPLEVRKDNRVVPVGADKVRVLLAVLLIHANRVAPATELVDRLWGPQVTAASWKTLQSYVYRLRSTLAAGGLDGDMVKTRGRGYLIEVCPDSVDLHRFTSLADRAKQAEQAGDLAEAVALLQEANALWTGSALTDVRSDSLHRDVLPALTEQRLQTLEQRMQLELRIGNHADVVAELQTLTSQHPLREQLWGHLMLALYRNGRQAEALQAYNTIRAILADEVGVYPGSELQRLYQRILHGDADLRAQPTSAPPAGAEQPVPPEPLPRPDFGRNDLPCELADFTGRDQETRLLLESIAGDAARDGVAISAIDGMAGVGKTSLAVRIAHQLTDRYPDAQLFIDLNAHTEGQEPTDPADALGTLLRAIGVPDEHIPGTLPERSALWRAQLATRRAIVVLDNAAGCEQIRPLLPGSPDCLVLVTSRRHLLDLDGGHTLSLDTLSPCDAAALFTRIVGEDRTAAEPEAVRKVQQLCGYLPLAIRMAAARLRSRRTWTVAHLADRLSAKLDGLATLSTGGRGVVTAFDQSYLRLAAGQRRLYRRLGLYPGVDHDARVAAVLTGSVLGEAERQLEDLVDVHLLQQPAPGRYRLHGLLRRHACQTALATESTHDQREAVHRVLDYYLHSAWLADQQLAGPQSLDISVTHLPPYPPELTSHATALAWLDPEHENLLALVTHAAEHGWYTHAWQLPYTMRRFFCARGHTDSWISTHQIALEAATELADRRAGAEIQRDLAIGYWHAGRYGQAIGQIHEALAQFRCVGDRRGEASALSTFGIGHLAFGHHSTALRYNMEALDICRSIEDPGGEAQALANLGSVYAEMASHEEAIDHNRRALAMFIEVDDARGEAVALTNLGVTYRRLGRHQEALELHHQALALNRQAGDLRAESKVLNDLGLACLAAGRVEESRGWHEQAMHLALDLGDRYQLSIAQASIARTAGECRTAPGTDSARPADRLALKGSPA